LVRRVCVFGRKITKLVREGKKTGVELLTEHSLTVMENQSGRGLGHRDELTNTSSANLDVCDHMEKGGTSSFDRAVFVFIVFWWFWFVFVFSCR